MIMRRLFLYLSVFSLVLISCEQKKTVSDQDNTDLEVYNRPDLAPITRQIQDNPDKAELYYERGRLLQNLYQDSLALMDFNKAIKLDSTKAEYYSAIGAILFEQKDISGSRKWIERAIDLNPKDPVAHLKLSKLLLFIQEYKEAINEANIVLRADPYNPEAYFLKGMVYKDMKDTSKAISSFQTSLNVVPEYKPAMIQLGQLYAYQNNDLAVQYYRNAYALDSQDVFPLYAIGVYYHNQNKLELAKQAYKEAILYDHQYGDALYNMGIALLDQDSVEKAYRQFDLLIKTKPNDPEAYYQRGRCLERMNKKEEATLDYQQALVFDKNFEEARTALNKISK